jgi:hypothetical protein
MALTVCPHCAAAHPDTQECPWWVRSAPTDPAVGLWCPRCRRRHGYTGPRRLGIDYRRDGAAFVLLWLCPEDGEVVQEKFLE